MNCNLDESAVELHRFYLFVKTFTLKPLISLWISIAVSSINNIFEISINFFLGSIIFNERDPIAF